MRQRNRKIKISVLKLRYATNKAMWVGMELICPCCGTKFTKSQHQQVFCRSKGGTVCKDAYWNRVDPTKRNNTTRFSPASIAWLTSDKGIMEINYRKFGVCAPNIVGGSGKIQGMTNEGYRIMDGVAYNEWDEPVYNVDVKLGNYDPGDSEYWDSKDFSL